MSNQNENANALTLADGIKTDGIKTDGVKADGKQSEITYTEKQFNAKLREAKKQWLNEFIAFTSFSAFTQSKIDAAKKALSIAKSESEKSAAMIDLLFAEVLAVYVYQLELRNMPRGKANKTAVINGVEIDVAKHFASLRALDKTTDQYGVGKALKAINNMTAEQKAAQKAALQKVLAAL